MTKKTKTLNEAQRQTIVDALSARFTVAAIQARAACDLVEARRAALLEAQNDYDKSLDCQRFAARPVAELTSALEALGAKQVTNASLNLGATTKWVA